MRIAILHPYLNGRGGSQRYVLEIAKNLELQGVDVEVFSYDYNKEECFPELVSKLKLTTKNLITNKNNVKKKFIYKLSYFKRIIFHLGIDYIYLLISNLNKAKQFSDIIKIKHNEKVFDLLFCHEEPLSVYACVNFKKTYNIPLYWFCYDSIAKWFLDWNPNGSNFKFRDILLTKLYFKIDKYLVNKYVNTIAVLDEKMVKKINLLYNRKSQIRYGGVSEDILNLKRSTFLKDKYSLDDDVIIICCISRFLPYKRLEDIFELSIQLKKNSTYKFFFYLNAPLADKHYFDKVMFRYKSNLDKNFILDTIPFSSDQDLYQIYLSSKIFIFPNEKQTWGHAPIEAIACGCISIVSDDCGISDLITKIAPRTIYKVGDIKDLSNKILNLLFSQNLSKTAILQMSLLRENLLWTNICKKYLIDFDDILQKK